MLLDVKGLKVYFKDENRVTKALDGIDFAVRDNEVVGLVGESGSGKTMTALSVMGLLPKGGYVEAGNIFFSGRDLLRLDGAAMRGIRGRYISMIFQEPFTSLNPVLSIGEQIEEAIRAHKALSKQDLRREAEALLMKVRIENPGKIYHDYPHQMSGGQRQRVMIAMALALGPRLLIADEPTTALDVTIQSEILRLILRIKKEFSMSVLFITHDVGVVNEIADRILVMKKGRIVEKGAKGDILKSPKHPYTKKLLDAVPKVRTKTDGVRERTTPFIRIKSLTKKFAIKRGLLKKKTGETKAVDEVSLDIKKGETLGLVGESAKRR